jgi:thiamine-phosphate pyrophosphorylase
MRRCYSAVMRQRQTLTARNLPRIWLVSDARNDAGLEQALKRLPRGSGLIFRHYHLDPAARRARFVELARAARRRGHLIALSGSVALARQWRADAAYGSPSAVSRGPAFPRLITAHSLTELARAHHARASAVLLSPVYPTRSHLRGRSLGPLRFRMIVARTHIPVIALGGMNPRRAARLGAHRWAAVDGLCT